MQIVLASYSGIHYYRQCSGRSNVGGLIDKLEVLHVKGWKALPSRDVSCLKYIQIYV